MGLVDRSRRVRLLARRAGRSGDRRGRRVSALGPGGPRGVHVRRSTPTSPGPGRRLRDPVACHGRRRRRLGGRPITHRVRDGDARGDEHHARPAGPRSAPAGGGRDARVAGRGERRVRDGRGPGRADRPAARGAARRARRCRRGVRRPGAPDPGVAPGRPATGPSGSPAGGAGRDPSPSAAAPRAWRRPSHDPSRIGASSPSWRS